MSALEPTLVIVEDDAGIQSQLRWCFAGKRIHVAGDRESAIECVRRHEPQVVTLDLGLPPDPGGASEGFGTLREILRIAPHTKIIVITGRSDLENAVRAVSMGAYDYYQKPVDAERLKFAVDKAFKLYQLEEENRRLSKTSSDSPLDGVIAISEPMMAVCRTIEKIAPTDVTTLLLGESGTGKEILAKALHGLSLRSKGRFVAINCAAIPETLLESELFGYEKGAFTGAEKQTLGKFEYANGGTLFLDEIGDLPLSLQAKLLRFLQERVIERVGGREEIPIDVRVFCATHSDLQTLLAEGRFREDLYYRVSGVALHIPPLRERPGDPVVLARAFLEKFARLHGRSFRGFSEDSIAAIEAYAWPGNVRELENKVKRAVIMADGNLVQTKDLELQASEEGTPALNLRQLRDATERAAVIRAIHYAQGNISQAARLLGVTRPTLYALINKFDLSSESLAESKNSLAIAGEPAVDS